MHQKNRKRSRNKRRGKRSNISTNVHQSTNNQNGFVCTSLLDIMNEFKRKRFFVDPEAEYMIKNINTKTLIGICSSVLDVYHQKHHKKTKDPDDEKKSDVQTQSSSSEHERTKESDPKHQIVDIEDEDYVYMFKLFIAYNPCFEYDAYVYDTVRLTHDHVLEFKDKAYSELAKTGKIVVDDFKFWAKQVPKMFDPPVNMNITRWSQSRGNSYCNLDLI